jgi:hypothetical protein
VGKRPQVGHRVDGDAHSGDERGLPGEVGQLSKGGRPGAGVEKSALAMASMTSRRQPVSGSRVSAAPVPAWCSGGWRTPTQIAALTRAVVRAGSSLLPAGLYTLRRHLLAHPDRTGPTTTR